jgi:hypothetical protein
VALGKVLEDFVRPDSPQKFDPSEMRLLYVAVTRVREGLDVPAAVLSFIDAKDGDGK